MNATLKSKPLIASELLDYLNKIFPPQKVSIEDSLQLIYFTAGSRYVVDYLKTVYESQQKENN